MRGLWTLAIGCLLCAHELTRDTPSGFYLMVGLALMLVGYIRWIGFHMEQEYCQGDADPMEVYRSLPELERDMALDKLSALWHAGMLDDESFWANADDVIARYEREKADSRQP